MGTIFVVSPCYLNAIFKESSKYNFNLQGYGSFGLASKGILRVNTAELLGFAFVGIHLPTPHTSEYKNMIQFFDLCEKMQSDKKFVIATEDPAGPWSKVFARYKHLRFVQTKQYDFLSDIVINQYIFGSILLDTASAYNLQQKNLKLPEYTTPKLQYVPLFTDAQLACVSHVDVLDIMIRTLQNDSVYKRFVAEDSQLQYFRKYLISRLHANTEEIAACRDKITMIIDSAENDAANWCTLQALCAYIEEVPA